MIETAPPPRRDLHPASNRERIGLFGAIALAAAAHWAAFLGYYQFDDIGWLSEASEIGSARDALLRFFRPFNEHLLPLPKMLAVFFLRADGIEYRLAPLWGLANLAAVQLLLWRLSLRWLRSPAARLSLVALFGTSPLLNQAVAWFSATIFMTSLALSLTAILGVERFAEGRRRSGLAAIAFGCFFAPMSSGVGWPTVVAAAAAAWFRIGAARETGALRWRAAAACALAATAAYALLFSICILFIAPIGSGAGGESLAPLERLAAGCGLALKALALRQWARIVFPPLGSMLMALILVALIAFRGRYSLRLAFGALACSIGWLAFVYIPRAEFGDAALDWGRYHVYPLVGTALLAALAVDGAMAAAPNLKRAKSIAAVAAIALLLANGYATSKLVHRDFGDSPRRFVGGFCREWATLVEEWAVRTGDGIVRLPDVRFAIVDFTEDLPLSTYSFCRPRQTKWRVEWLPADRPFPPDFVAFITSHPNAGTVRHFLRHDLYPEQFPDRSAR